ncbi:MAG: lysoplasmalogenase [Clostridiaceae bacterium]|nr:lysoplasmalogenase [Clostridiaceae bacterium]
MDNYFRFIKGIPGAFILTVLMSFFALLLALIFRTPSRWLIFAAMLLSSLGDFTLMRDFTGIFRSLPFDKLYLGAAFFLLAHLLYITAFTYLLRSGGYRLWNAGFCIGIALFCIAFTVILYSYIHNRPRNPTLLITALLYLVVISFLCALIGSYGFWAGSRRYLAVLGSVSFFVSDFIIALGVFRITNAYDRLIWWFYPIGQILLILGG